VHGHLGGLPPVVDLARERLLGEILVAGSRDGMLTAAHDVSDGGTVQSLVEMALRAQTGARCWVPDGIDPFTFLFSESAGRAVVVVARTEELRFTEMCAARGLPAFRMGVVDSGLGPDAGFEAGVQVLQFSELFTVTLDELRAAHDRTLPSVLQA
jgi:phosphoribosylformylglycinamidine synthase